MSVSPRFSVVMPAFNAEQTVGSAICSVLRQTCPDFELIVVDDGSSDRTAEVAAGFASRHDRVRLLRQENRGPGAARNAAIKEAEGAFVSMIDSDDLWLSDYLVEMDAALAAAPSAGFAYTDAWLLDGMTGRVRTQTAMAGQRPPAETLLEPDVFLDELLRRNFVYTAVTIRRSVLDEVVGFDERFWIAEDYELWVRIAGTGRAGVRVPKVLAIHRDWHGSLTSDSVRSVSSLADVYDVIADEHDLDDDAQAYARRRSRAWRRGAELLEQPSALRRARGMLRRLHIRVSPRAEWLDPPPSEVAETLSACLSASERDGT